MDCQYGMFDFRAPDGYLYLTLCAPGTRRFIPNVVLHQHKIAFCAPIRAPSTNAVRWTCPAHAPLIPYWMDWYSSNQPPPAESWMCSKMPLKTCKHITLCHVLSRAQTSISSHCSCYKKRLPQSPQLRWLLLDRAANCDKEIRRHYCFS